jgi:hypothetical protein
LVKQAQKENPDVDVLELRRELDQRPDVQYLNMLDSEKD